MLGFMGEESLKDITVEELIKIKQIIPVDVRSPQEYLEGSIPGAVNVPLFSNEERKEIGTIYKQVGQNEAKWRAMEIVSPKIPTILGRIREIGQQDSVPVLYCWRGGMRSKSVAAFLEYAGVSVHRLQGGYKAFRQYLLEQIPFMLPDKALVLHGMTGVGKTEILIKLKELGYPVLDIEALAAHKGSIFGALGINEGNNQKTFDSLLFSALRELEGSPFFVIEAESKRIGKVAQPDELLEKKLSGTHFQLHSSMSTRVNRITQEYVKPYFLEEGYQDKIRDKLTIIQKRIKDMEIRALLMEELEKRNYQSLIKLLLEHYYDPRYQHRQLDYNGEFISINTDNLHEAVNKIIDHIENSYPKLFSNR